MVRILRCYSFFDDFAGRNRGIPGKRPGFSEIVTVVNPGGMMYNGKMISQAQASGIGLMQIPIWRIIS